MIDDIKITKDMMQAFSRLPLQTIDGVELHRLLYIKYPQPAGASLEPARNYSRALMFGANLHQPVEQEFAECQIATHPIQERDHLEVLVRPEDFESRPELAVWIAEKNAELGPAEWIRLYFDYVSLLEIEILSKEDIADTLRQAIASRKVEDELDEIKRKLSSINN